MVLAVSIDTDTRLVAPFVREHKLTFPHLLDPESRVAGIYGMRYTPTNFVIDREGRVVAGSVGYRDWASRASFSLFEHVLRAKELALGKKARP